MAKESISHFPFLFLLQNKHWAYCVSWQDTKGIATLKVLYFMVNWKWNGPIKEQKTYPTMEWSYNPWKPSTFNLSKIPGFSSTWFFRAWGELAGSWRSCLSGESWSTCFNTFLCGNCPDIIFGFRKRWINHWKIGGIVWGSCS